MTRKPLTKEQYELWLKIKDLAKQRADETGVFPMTYREASELSGGHKRGCLLIPPLLKHGLIVKHGKISIPDLADGNYRTLCTWKIPDLVPEVPQPDLPDSKAIESTESQLWEAIRQILVHWSYDERQIKEVAASAGHEWKIACRSKPLGWFLSMSWEELLEHRDFRAHRALSLLKAMCSLAGALNPDAVSAHPTYQALAEMAQPIAPPHDQRPEAWDRAREKLRSCGKTSLTLAKLSDAVGLPWPYLHGDWPLDDLLDRSWGDLRIRRGFGEKRQQAILDLVSCAVDNFAAVEKAAQREALVTQSAALDAQLRALGLERTLPLDLLFLSGRAREHLKNEGLSDLGAVLDYLARTSLDSLTKARNVGSKTAQELLRLLQGVLTLDLDQIRKFLPLRAEGKGISYAAYARLCLREFIPSHRDWFFQYFVLGQTQEKISIQNDADLSCVHKHVVRFKQCLEKALAYFPDDGRRIQKAWESGEPIANAINWEMDETDRATICAVLDKVLRSISEPEGTNAEQDRMFVTWWKQLQQLPEFSGEGVSLSQFLQDRGHPELQAQFIQYLDTRPLAYYCGLTGTVAHIYAYHWSKQ